MPGNSPPAAVLNSPFNQPFESGVLLASIRSSEPRRLP